MIIGLVESTVSMGTSFLWSLGLWSLVESTVSMGTSFLWSLGLWSLVESTVSMGASFFWGLRLWSLVESTVSVGVGRSGNRHSGGGGGINSSGQGGDSQQGSNCDSGKFHSWVVLKIIICGMCVEMVVDGMCNINDILTNYTNKLYYHRVWLPEKNQKIPVLGGKELWNPPLF